jgi:hypothetical protein
MNRRATPGRQRGMVAALLIALLVLGGVLFVFSSSGFTTVRVERERSTLDALAKSKEALIAYAVSHADNVPVAGAPARPGTLPCPDVDDDGHEDYDIATDTCRGLTGRLPWITLGLPEPRDDSGERLWYSVSNDFRSDRRSTPGVPLNSDTAYRAGNVSLALSGSALGANLAAVVIAPGRALQRSDGFSQSRGCTVGFDCDATFRCTTAPASATAKCNPANYLDVAAAEDNADANRSFIAAAEGPGFNDRLMPVFSDDIMVLVERRAARELAERLRDHYEAWRTTGNVGNTKGFYPWAASLNDPSVAAAGVSGVPAGQLPFSTSAVQWSAAGWTLGGCAGVNSAEIQCNGLLGIPLLLTINGTVRNVGTAFIDPPSAANVTVVSGLVIGAPTVTWTLNPATQTLSFTWSALAVGLPTTVRVRVPEASAWTNSGWLATNNWYQNAFYALSTGYALNGANACGGTCITITNTVAPNNDKRAVVAISGRALSAAGQATRPVAPPANAVQFLEGLNPDATYTVLEANARSTTFNDTLAAVRPSP